MVEQWVRLDFEWWRSSIIILFPWFSMNGFVSGGIDLKFDIFSGRFWFSVRNGVCFVYLNAVFVVIYYCEVQREERFWLELIFWPF